HRVHVDDALAVDAIEQRVGFQAPAVASRAHPIAAIARQKHAHVHAVRPSLEPAKPATDAVVLLVATIAVDDQTLLRISQAVERNVHRNALSATELGELVSLPTRFRRGPRLDGAIRERLAPVRNDEV